MDMHRLLNAFKIQEDDTGLAPHQGTGALIHGSTPRSFEPKVLKKYPVEGGEGEAPRFFWPIPAQR